ncbi:hypothetical protein LXL04_012045 [Taraxacum kok-saghyz]
MQDSSNRRRQSLRQAKFALRRFANTSSNPVQVANSDDENQNNVDNQNIMIDPPINVIHPEINNENNPEVNNENNPEINNENNPEINNENIDEDLNMNIDANEEVDTEDEIDENQLNIVVQNIQATSENQNEEDEDESMAQKESRTRNLLQISEKDASAKSSTSKKIGWTKGKLKQLIQSTTTVKEVGTSTSGRKRKREYRGEKRTSTRKNTNPYATITPFKGFRTNEMTKRIRSNEKLKKDQKATKRLTPRKKTIQQKEKKKKRTVAVHRAINYPFGLRVKTSPAPMMEAVKFMSADQRDAVAEMGFGAFLDMKMEQCPAKLGHFLVENLDDKNLVLRTGKRDIKLTTDVVHEVFVISNGGLDIDNIKPVKRANEFFKLWKSQYPENIARTKILEKIRETDDDGIVFKLNFITLFVNCFCETYTSGFYKKNIVYKIAGVEDISQLDWCSYVLKAVRGSKNNWVPNDVTSIYAGPIAFLVLTYMQLTRGPEDNIPMIPPAIEAWDFDMVKRREKKELERGGFGCFEEDGDQDLPEVVVREKTREEDLMDIRSKMRKICRYEAELLDTFWKYLDKDPQDEEILNLKEEFHIMFGKTNNSSSGEEDNNDDNDDDKRDDDGDDNSGDDGDNNTSDDDNNDEGDGNEDESVNDADNNKSDDGNNNKGGDGIDQEGDNADKNEDGGDADKNEDAGDADKNEDAGDADSSNKGNDDDLLNTETRENVGGEAVSSEPRKTIGGESMETNVVNTESEIMEDQTPQTPQPTSHPVEELKKDSRLRDPRLKPTNNATDLKNQMPSSSTTAASSNKIFTKDEPKYTIFDDEPISEYMLQVCIELENIALSGKIDKNDKRYIYVNHGAIKTERQKNDTKDVKDEGPNFDLGISQEFGSVLNDIGAKPVDTEGKPVNVPLVNPDNEIDHDIEEETPLIKRLRNPSKYKVSPYYKKNVEVLDLIKPIELTISNRLFALDGDVHSTVFETEDGMNVSRVVLETLIPNTWIAVDLLNVWTMILNYEEGLKTRVNAKKVYFNVIVLEEKNFDKDANLDELYKIFEDKANETLKMWKIKSLKKVNLVYFPIFHYDHYYIYVFDLKTNTVHLFDNRKDFPADGYNKSPKRMIDFFSRFLAKKKHPSAEVISKKQVKCEKMKWQTVYNDIDCGIFAMRHLECYTGGVISKFDCGLVKESEQQSSQLIKLRKKYATKILMSDLNIKMKSFLEDANSFQKIEESTRKNILYNAYKDRQKRFDFIF